MEDLATEVSPSRSRSDVSFSRKIVHDRTYSTSVSWSSRSGTASEGGGVSDGLRPLCPGSSGVHWKMYTLSTRSARAATRGSVGSARPSRVPLDCPVESAGDDHGQIRRGADRPPIWPLVR